MSSLNKILTGFGVLAGICIVAIARYVYEGWGLSESIYMVVITVFGVGYGEVQPIRDPQLMWFTIVFIVVGCTAGIYVVGGFIQMVTEGEINRALNERRKSRGLGSLRNHVIICGFGRMGQIVARELHGVGHAFVIIDSDEHRIQQAEEAGYLVLLGDAAEENILLQAGIERASALASVLSDDASNVFITLTARDLNDSLSIIARGESPSTEKKLLRSGADQVVLPAAIGGLKISNMITRPSVEQLLMTESGREHWNEELREIGLGVTEIPIHPQMTIMNRVVRDVEFLGNGGLILLAIKRADGSFIKNPHGDEVIQDGDRVLLLGNADGMPQLIAKATEKKAALTYRGVKS